MRNLKRLCRGGGENCYYLEYETTPENKRDWDAPRRYKLRWIKKKKNDGMDGNKDDTL